MTPRRLFLERLESRAMLAVYTVDFAGGANPNDGLTSFLEAYLAANNTPEADIIEFAPTLSGSSITMPIDSPDVRYNLTIRGLGSDQLTINPRPNSDFLGFSLQFEVTHFEISGVTFAPQAGNSARFRNLVQNSRGEVLLEDVVATGVTRDAITSLNGTVTLVDTRLIGDQTSTGSQQGLGIKGSQNEVTVRLEDAEITGFRFGGVQTTGNINVFDSTITGLGILSSGTGLLSLNGQVVVERSSITANQAGFGASGGGIRARWGVTVMDSTINNNTALSGGGVYAQDGPLTITNSTISDNTATPGNFVGGGGAVKDGTTGTVIISGSSFSGNRVTGNNSNGGALFSRTPFTVSGSTFTDNHTTSGIPVFAAALSAGGAIYSYGATSGPGVSRLSSIIGSHFESNSVAGRDSDGGAVWVGGIELNIDSSTFRNNSTNGMDGDGGAVHMGNGVISNSTFIGNQTSGDESDGGAIAHFGSSSSGGSLVIINTTISDNATVGSNSEGGGVYTYGGQLDFRFSTIADNRVEHLTSRGGGIAFRDPNAAASNFGGATLWHSIVGDNTAVGNNPDLYLKNDSIVCNYTLIENANGLTTSQLAAINAGTGNLLGFDPFLGLLADNGGPTWTRLPLVGSPAIDMGDPSLTNATPNVPAFDQRGFPYERIDGGKVDLGAVEVQPTPAYADFDGDFDVDGRDFLAWQRGLGTPNAEKVDGDADDDQDVDGDDLTVWQYQYGEPTNSPQTVSTALVSQTELTESITISDQIDVALSFTLASVSESEEPHPPEEVNTLDEVFHKIGSTSNPLPATFFISEANSIEEGSREIDEFQQLWLTESMLENVFGETVD